MIFSLQQRFFSLKTVLNCLCFVKLPSLQKILQISSENPNFGFAEVRKTQILGKFVRDAVSLKFFVLTKKAGQPFPETLFRVSHLVFSLRGEKSAHGVATAP